MIGSRTAHVLEDQVISIKRYLTEYSKLSAEKGYPRSLGLVLEGLAKSAIEGDIGENSKGRTFEINGREVMIAINANWTVVPVEDSELSVRAQMDTFIASQLPAIHTGT